MGIDKNLPEIAYAVSPYTNKTVRIVRGDTCFYGIRGADPVQQLNEACGVSRAQAAAMLGGVQYGWSSQHAQLDNYKATGEYIGPEEAERTA